MERPRSIGVDIEPTGDAALKNRRALAIFKYIDDHVIAGHAANPTLESELAEHYKTLTPRERADMLYEKVVAYRADQETGAEPNPDLIAEIKVLFGDPETLAVAGQSYGEARIDSKENRLSSVGNEFKKLNGDIEKAETEFKTLEQQLFLKKIEGSTNISAAKSKIERLAKRLLDLKTKREDLAKLRGKEQVDTNTDAVAAEQYQTYLRYQEQMRQGFVWLPSRQRIHQETIAALQNGRWPVLIGEAGTGKSDQADAAAIELTGNPPTEIQCEQNTSEKQLIGDSELDPATGGSFTKYGPLMQAFTGYEDSRQTAPSIPTGRVARFDESGRLGPKAYAVIKNVRQKKPGDDFYGHKVLPGAAAVWTTNPVGPRYPDRRSVDPAMRRELAEIKVDYPEQSELYDFMIAGLLDEKGHITVAKKELAPGYKKTELAGSDRKKVEGGTAIAKLELIQDQTSAEHGTLWRLSCAVKALQNSFIYGNESGDAADRNILRFTEDSSGVITIAKTGGEHLTLASSTITLGEVRSWMTGFGERLQKSDPAFHTKTFTEWIQLKIRTYLKQVDQADKAKVEAIFNHFGLLTGSPDLTDERPITPQEIGYLSVAVPRPLIVEKPKAERAPVQTPEAAPETNETYTSKEVLLESGTKVRIAEKDFSGESKLSKTFELKQGASFTVDDRDYLFAGVASEAGTQGKTLAGKSANEDLYKLFTPEEVELGILRHRMKSVKGDVEFFKSASGKK